MRLKIPSFVPPICLNEHGVWAPSEKLIILTVFTQQLNLYRNGSTAKRAQAPSQPCLKRIATLPGSGPWKLIVTGHDGHEWRLSPGASFIDESPPTTPDSLSRLKPFAGIPNLAGYSLLRRVARLWSGSRPSALPPKHLQLAPSNTKERPTKPGAPSPRRSARMELIWPKGVVQIWLSLKNTR